jgi:hypothetical protein
MMARVPSDDWMSPKRGSVVSRIVETVRTCKTGDGLPSGLAFERHQIDTHRDDDEDLELLATASSADDPVGDRVANDILNRAILQKSDVTLCL